MSVVQTTAGIFSTNGNLNVQGNISASAFSYVDSSGINHDITTAIENVATNASTVTNIISGSVKVGDAIKSDTIVVATNTSTNTAYLNFTTSTSGSLALYSSTAIHCDPVYGHIGISGALNCTNLNLGAGVLGGYVIMTNDSVAMLTSANLGSLDTTLSISGSLSTINTSLNTISGSVVTLSNNTVNLTTAQTIAGAKTFTSLSTFSGGVSINGDTETGNLSLSSTSIFTIPVGSSLLANSKSVTAANLGWISGLASTPCDTTTVQTIGGAKTFSAASTFSNGITTVAGAVSYTHLTLPTIYSV